MNKYSLSTLVSTTIFGIFLYFGALRGNLNGAFLVNMYHEKGSGTVTNGRPNLYTIYMHMVYSC